MAAGCSLALLLILPAPSFGARAINGAVGNVSGADGAVLSQQVGFRIYSASPGGESNINDNTSSCRNVRCLRAYSTNPLLQPGGFVSNQEATQVYNLDIPNQPYYMLADACLNDSAANHIGWFGVGGVTGNNSGFGNHLAAGCPSITATNCFLRIDDTLAGADSQCTYHGYPADGGHSIPAIGGLNPIPNVRVAVGGTCPAGQICLTWSEPPDYATAMRPSNDAGAPPSPVRGITLYRYDSPSGSCVEPTGAGPWTQVGQFPLGAGAVGTQVPRATCPSPPSAPGPACSFFALKVRLIGPGGLPSTVETACVGVNSWPVQECSAFCDDANTCTDDVYASDPCSGPSCSHLARANGAACNDGNGCTQTDACQSGACIGSNPVVCPPPNDACRTASCNAANGTCLAANGTPCNDGNPCTQTDACQTGVCGGSAVSDGTACSDGLACTLGEDCRSGNCLASVTFANAAGSPYQTGTAPASVDLGDLNGDGSLDLAVANTTSNNVTILLGNGAGGFAPGSGSPVAAGTKPWSVAIADLNGDGSLDLALTNDLGTRGRVSILLGDGTGGFAPSAGSPISWTNPGATNSYFVAVGDLNGDGSLDLAVTNRASISHYVTILLGNGSGGFSQAPGSPVSVGGIPVAVAVGEFNGDANLDLAVTNDGTGTVTILLGNGSGGFSEAPGSPVSVGTNPVFIAIGEFNSDGRRDLAIANSGSDDVTVLLGNGSGGFAPAPGSPVSAGGVTPVSVAVGDINGDGKVDLAVARSAASLNYSVLLGNGAGGFTLRVQTNAGLLPSSIEVGDVNGDGKLDLAVANKAGNNVSILLNTQASGPSPAAEVDSGVRVRPSGGTTAIDWNFAACASSSEVLRGSVSGLPVGPGGGDETCLANGLPPTTLTWTDGANPAVGAAYWYLVRGDAPGGHGPYGFQWVNGMQGAEEVSTTCP